MLENFITIRLSAVIRERVNANLQKDAYNTIVI